jgi:hypothetical protein
MDVDVRVDARDEQQPRREAEQEPEHTQGMSFLMAATETLSHPQQSQIEDADGADEQYHAHEMQAPPDRLTPRGFGRQGARRWASASNI